MSDRIDQLALRRRQLLLRSERLRADLAADQQTVLHALSGVDRALSMAKMLASPVLLSLAGTFALRFLRGRGGRAASRPMGFAMRGLMWISTARRVLSALTVVRALLRSRAARREADAEL